MSDLSSLLAPFRKRVEAYRDHGTPGLHAPQDRAKLLAALDAVIALADESDIYDQDYGERLAVGHVSTDVIRAAVTAALREQA